MLEVKIQEVRVQHFAAECVKELNQNFNDFIFASFSTDGHDYIKNVSGVMYNKSDVRRILKEPKYLKTMLKNSILIKYLKRAIHY